MGIREREGRERAEARTLLVYVAHRLTFCNVSLMSRSLSKGVNNAAHPPGGSPAEIGSLTASSLPLVPFRRFAMNRSPAKLLIQNNNYDSTHTHTSTNTHTHIHPYTSLRHTYTLICFNCHVCLNIHKCAYTHIHTNRYYLTHTSAYIHTHTYPHTSTYLPPTHV